MRIMKKRKGILSILLCLTLTVMNLPTVVYGEVTESVAYEVWVQNAADRAFESSTKQKASKEEISLYAAKNEYEASQILVRGGDSLTNVVLEATDLIGEQGNIAASNIAIFREYSSEAEVPGDIEKTPDGSNRYTDALLPNTTLTVPANLTQPYWIRVYVPENQQPGVYQGAVTIHTDQGDRSVPLKIQVYDVTIPKTNEAQFKMINWFGSVGCDFGALQSSVPSQYNVELYDENWWKVMENFAKDLALHRNNVEFIDFQALLMPGSTVDEAGNYHFDWSNFDRLVDIFIQAGALQYIYAPGSYLEMGNDKIMNLWVLEQQGNQMVRVRKPIYLDQAAEIVDPKIEAYMATLFGALREHMGERYPEYVDKMYISAQDEPSDKEQIKAANWFYKTVKKYYKEARSNEAHSRFITGLTETTTFCPVLDVYETNQQFYDNQKDIQGKELWYYTCIGPQGDYLNRFIPFHLVKTRLIPWYVYKIGATGYLHWGYCWWRTSDTFDSKQTGDEWLVRPDVKNYDVFTSVRNEAQLDGIEDYELLKILEKQNKELADQVVERLITSATLFAKQGEAAVQAHKQLLDFITGNSEVEPVEVLVFEEQFESGYDYAWKRQSLQWDASNHKYELHASVGNTEGMSNLKDWNIADGKIEVDLSIGNTYNQDDTMWGGIVFRKNAPEDTMWQSGYTLYVRKNGQVELLRSNPFQVLATANVSANITSGVRVSIVMNGNQIKVYEEGTEQPIISVVDDSFQSGYLSLNGTGAELSFDNFKLYSYRGPQNPQNDTTLITNQSYRDVFSDALTNWEITGDGKIIDQQLLTTGRSSLGLKQRVFGEVEIDFDLNLNGEQSSQETKDYWGGISFGKQTVYSDIWNTGGYLLIVRKDGTVELLDHTGVLASGNATLDTTKETHIKVVRQADTTKVYIEDSTTPVLIAQTPNYLEGFFSLESDGGSVIFDTLSATGVRQNVSMTLLDDFSGTLDSWKKTQYGEEAYIEQGALVTKGVVTKVDAANGIQGNGVSPELVWNKQIFGDVRFSVDIKIDDVALAENWAGVFFHSAGTEGFWKSGGYLVYLTNLNNIVLYEHGRGNLATAVLPANPMNDFINLQIEVSNHKIRIYVDYSETPIMEVETETYTSGYFGLMSDYCDACYDNISYCVPVAVIDDFSVENTLWQYNLPERTKVADGVLHLLGKDETGDGGISPDPYVSLKNQVIGDGFISFDMRITDKQKPDQEFWAGCAVRTTTEKGFWGNGGYLIYYATDGMLTVYREGAGALQTVDTYIKPTTEFVNVKIELIGDTLRVYLNRANVPVIEVKDSAFQEGYFSLIADWTNAEFDNVIAQGFKPTSGAEVEPVLDQDFSDDFESGNADKWEVINRPDGSFQVLEGKYRAVGTSGANAVLSSPIGHIYQNAEIEFDMTLKNKNSWAGIQLRRTNRKDSIWSSGYFMYYDQAQEELKLFKSGVGDVAIGNIGRRNGETVHLRIRMYENQIQIYVDGASTPVIDYTDEGNTFAKGYIALCSYMATVDFDNVVITKAELTPTVTPEPTPEVTPVLDEAYADDFNLGTANNWEVINPEDGSYEAVDGKYHAVGTSGANPVLSSLIGHSYQNAEIEFDMTLGNENSWAGMQLRKSNFKDSIWASGYFMYYDQGQEELKLFKANVGDVAKGNIGRRNGETVHLRIRMYENQIQIYVDGASTPVIDYIDQENTFAKGYIALCAYKATVDFDNVVIHKVEPTPEITPSVTPEPTPEPTPEVTPSVTPEPTPEVTPSVTPEPTPEVTPSVIPEPTQVPEKKELEFYIQEGVAKVVLNLEKMESLKLPESLLYSQLHSDTVKEITLEVNTVKGEIPELLLPKEMLQLAKEKEKNFSYVVRNSDGTISYEVIIDAENLKKVCYLEDFLLGIHTEELSKNKTVQQILGVSEDTAEGVYISVQQEGALPTQSQVRLYVGGKEGVKAFAKLYLYAVNTTTGKLEPVPFGTTYSVDRYGYVTLDLIKGNGYVLLPKKAQEQVITPTKELIVVEEKLELKRLEKTKLEVTLPFTLESVRNFAIEASLEAKGRVIITQSSSNPQVATIDKFGVITAKKAGKVLITTTVRLYYGATYTYQTEVTIQ